MSSVKSRFLKSLVIIQQLFSCRKMASSPSADLKTLEEFGYKFNSDGESFNSRESEKVIFYFDIFTIYIIVKNLTICCLSRSFEKTCQ